MLLKQLISYHDDIHTISTNIFKGTATQRCKHDDEKVT